MAKVSPIQSDFSGGEFSPLLYGRVDTERYKGALGVCKNYVPIVQGPLVRRSGTKFVAEVKDSSKATRLVRFEFSITQAYIIEFGDDYLRFYKDNGIITQTAQNITAITQANPAVVTYSGADTYANGDRVILSGILGMTELNNKEFVVANVNAGANTFELSGVNSTSYTAYSSGGTVAEIYEIVSPYQESELFELKMTQSADVLYITHPNYRPRKLTRTGHTAWTLTSFANIDGPYLSTNATTTTLTPSGTSGTVTITASAVTGINGNTGFQTTDVGRWIRFKDSGNTWHYADIITRVSTTEITASFNTILASTTASSTWRLGSWSDTTGYPGSVTFHEDRLFFSGTDDFPQRLDGSRSGDYENFAPTAGDGTVASSHAVSFTLNSSDVNVIRWMSSDEKGLMVGTVAGEWAVRAASINEALSPTNITAKPATHYGSANIQPVRVGKAAIFVQRSGRKVYEMTYFFDSDGFQASDMARLAEQATTSGVKEIAYQKEPQPIVWCVRQDGVLAAMTYERDLETLRVGWGRHIIGGSSDAAGTSAQVESVAVIPAPSGTHEEVWIVVKRYINGGTKRYVEYITKFFEDSDEQRDAFFVDSGLTYDSPLTITGITNANPAVVTSNSHGLSNGDRVRITDVQGFKLSSDDDAESAVNGESFTVANVAANTFQLSGLNSTSYTAYISGGEARKLVTTVSGLNHLEGETVSVLADGAVRPDQTVTSGRITLNTAAGTVHAGYGYESDGQTLRIEAGAADGTALGKKRRAHEVGLLLHRSLGLKLGSNFDELDELTFRTSTDPMTRAPALFSGILTEKLHQDYDTENYICWRQDQPLPSTILAIMPQMVTQDKG